MDLENSPSFENQRQNQGSIEEEGPRFGLQKEDASSQPTLNVKQYVYAKTKSYWLQKINQALSKTKQQEPEETNTSPPKITEVIKDGLELQDYMQKYTNFFKLYLQEIKPDYVQYNTRKKRFVPQAKLMLKIFVQKNKNALEYFYDGLDWVEHRLNAYSFIVDEKLCIKKIMDKLVHNKYEEQQDFFLDMAKMFEDCIFYNFNNEKMKNMILKMKENWEIIKLKVLQLYNFGVRPCINPDPNMEPEMMDINAEINILKRKVEIWNSKVQEADYDPEIFERGNNLMSRENHDSKKESEPRKKGKPRFQSGNRSVETVSRERMLKLRKEISQMISEGVRSKNQESAGRKLHSFIKSNQRFMKNNEINLEDLSLDDFVEIQALVQKLKSQ